MEVVCEGAEFCRDGLLGDGCSGVRGMSFCGTCKYFSYDDDGLGECRVVHPKIDEYGDGIFPVVRQTMWCGEYQKRGESS
jgi:hypothetical protein